MNKLEAIKTFCLVAELGSYTAAAKQLNVSATMTSRYVKQLEQELGTLLFKRNTRKVHLTEAGQHYRQHIKPLLKKLELVENQVSHYGRDVVGALRLSASFEFGGLYLAPLIDSFKKQYPLVDIEAHLCNEPLDLYESNIDLFFRVAPALKSASHIAQQVAVSRLSCWASPDYLVSNGTPSNVTDLANHSCLFFNHSIRKDQWIFKVDQQLQNYKLNWHWSSNSGKLLNQAASEGMGIVQAPSYSVAPYVDRGELVEVLAEYCIDPLTISVIYPHKQELPKRTRAFIEHSKAYFQRNPIP